MRKRTLRPMEPKILGSNLRSFSRENGELLFNGYRVSIWEDKKVLGMNRQKYPLFLGLFRTGVASLGVESELQQLAYDTAIATPDSSRV